MVEEYCNVLFLAGRIVSDVRVEDKRGFFMIQTGKDEKKWIACTVFDDSDLAKKLDRFQKGDFIKVQGFLRIWSRKQEDDTWKDNAECRITHIKSEAPKRAAASTSAHGGASSRITDDDDFPY